MDAKIYLPVLFILLIGSLFSGGFILLSWLLGPKKENASKFSPYECGAPPIGDTRHRFSVKFFLVAIIFILFDVEAVFLYPWAVLFRHFVQEGKGVFFLVEIGFFLAVLGIGWGYVWKMKALEWEE